MSDNTYQRLCAFLDQFPLGFPKTDSGLEITILKRLFTEDEAQTVTLLTPFPEEASQTASRMNLDEAVLKDKLESLADKGLIFRIRRGDKTLYNAVPFMIGLYEYSVQDIDAELAALYKDYYEQAYQAEMAASDVPGFKVIPIGHTIDEEMVLIPSCRLEEEVRKARVISVAPCICRKEAVLTGKGCDKPEETCLHFGAAAEYYIENRIGRQIGADEALAIIEKADRAGLVHAGVNTQHLSNLCNCCPCCCASMKGITQKGMDKHGFLNALFMAVIDPDLCTGCGICVDRCPIEAMSVDDYATTDMRKCLGCGLCSTTCPVDAITMHLRQDREEPFDTVIDMGLAILRGKVIAKNT
ncbi:MAG: 4Fe-4S binding protein [Desulfomonilia bacterium]|jgi:Pyruvate/2-oxoacid:ferredoxin oxidoreductase delta subunit